MKKLCGFITLVAALFCVYFIRENYGNLFYMSYTINSAKKICSQNYGSELITGSYRFDKALGRYIVDVSDKNGLSGTIVYTAENGIENKYADDYESVCKNIMRGRFQNLLNSGTATNISCSISLKSIDTGIIGDDDGKCETVCLDFGEIKNKEEFAKRIVEAFEIIRGEEFEEIRAVCSSGKNQLEFCSEKRGVSLNPADIMHRITEIID